MVGAVVGSLCVVNLTRQFTTSVSISACITPADISAHNGSLSRLTIIQIVPRRAVTSKPSKTKKIPQAKSSCSPPLVWLTRSAKSMKPRTERNVVMATDHRKAILLQCFSSFMFAEPTPTFSGGVSRTEQGVVGNVYLISGYLAFLRKRRSPVMRKTSPMTPEKSMPFCPQRANGRNPDAQNKTPRTIKNTVPLLI